ncbi:MAG: PLP-dependent transferase [Ignavibacteriales bacterium]|nr:PLP-dependent transferase [Ignavibacteriales bacterium]
MFSSGMAAISTTMFSVLRPGDVLLASAPVYGGTEFLVENILPQFGIQRVWFGSGGAAAVARRRASARATAARPDRDDLPRDAGQPHQRPRGHRRAARRSRARWPTRTGGARWWPSTTRSSGRSGSARSQHGADFVVYSLDEVRGRPQRPHRRRLPRQARTSSRRCAACARSSARFPTRTRAGC